MIQIKHQFYRKGTKYSKRSDLTIELKRPDLEQLKKWDSAERSEALKFIEKVKKEFDAYEKIISDPFLL